MSPAVIAADMFWRIHFCSGQGFSFDPHVAPSAEAGVGAAAMAAAPSTIPAMSPHAIRPFIRNLLTFRVDLIICPRFRFLRGRPLLASVTGEAS